MWTYKIKVFLKNGTVYDTKCTTADEASAIDKIKGMSKIMGLQYTKIKIVGREPVR